MIGFLRPLRNAMRRFHRSEDGNGTIEFVILVPLIIMVTFSSYETGMLTTRQVMLERGVDVVVRRIRIGALPNPEHDDLKLQICQEAVIIPDCYNQIKLEMVVRDPRNWAALTTTPDCVDRDEPGAPLNNFGTGGNNQLMVLRVCALFDPVMPNAVIGTALPKESGGAYALTATSSFVMEPFNQ